MFPQLPSPHSVSRFFTVRRVPVGFPIAVTAAAVMFVELFGPARTFKFMALAGHTRHRNSHDKQKETFHRAASYPVAPETQPPSVREFAPPRNQRA